MHLEWRNVTVDHYPPNIRPMLFSHRYLLTLLEEAHAEWGRSTRHSLSCTSCGAVVNWSSGDNRCILPTNLRRSITHGLEDVCTRNNDIGNTALKKSVSRSVQQSTWKTGDSLSISTSIEASIPFISVDIGFTFEKTFTTTKAISVTAMVDHSLSLETKVPPRHVCRVKMVGEQYKANMPFTAKQLRVYDNGDKRRTMITGVYYGTQVGETKAVAERCLSVDGEQPNYSY